jgi:Fimbrial assembly protein (PilN)
MAQHINLMHAGLARRSEPFSSGHAAVGMVAASVLVALAAFALHLQGRLTAERAANTERDVAALQARIAQVAGTPPPSPATTELQRLRQREAGQRQMRAAIASGSAGRAQGYAEYFNALARQAQPQLWITGFSLAGDGVALELNGRMADPRVLPDYLRRLNTEPMFKGREFAQLSLKKVEPSAAATGGYTEFALRGLPAATEAPR